MSSPREAVFRFAPGRFRRGNRGALGATPAPRVRRSCSRWGRPVGGVARPRMRWRNRAGARPRL